MPTHSVCLSVHLPRLVPDSQQSFCLNLASAGITGSTTTPGSPSSEIRISSLFPGGRAGLIPGLTRAFRSSQPEARKKISFLVPPFLPPNPSAEESQQLCPEDTRAALLKVPTMRN